MWGIAKDSEGEPSGELWGLFLPDGDVTWQNKALCSQTDPEAFFSGKRRFDPRREACVRAMRGTRAMPELGYRA